MADPKNYDDADDPYRAIRVGDPGLAGEATKWGHLLTRFMRLIAVFWLLQGLLQWQAVLTAQKPIFDTMPQSAALAIIFFSVLDLIAGVGLWLATPWGGVLWLLIASAQIFVAASMPRFFAGGYWLIGVDLVLIVLYFALTFEAGRDFEAQNVIDRRRKRRAAGQTGPAEAPAAPETKGPLSRGSESKSTVANEAKPIERAPQLKGESRKPAAEAANAIPKPPVKRFLTPGPKTRKPGEA
jgi:hypothetical protein